MTTRMSRLCVSSSADYCLEHSDELDELAHTSTAWAGYPDDWAAASDELMDEVLGVLL